jgi:hypothetical protein
MPRVYSNGIRFIPNFVRIDLLVQTLKGPNTQTAYFFLSRKKSKLKTSGIKGNESNLPV